MMFRFPIHRFSLILDYDTCSMEIIILKCVLVQDEAYSRSGISAPYHMSFPVQELIDVFQSPTVVSLAEIAICYSYIAVIPCVTLLHVMVFIEPKPTKPITCFFLFVA